MLFLALLGGFAWGRLFARKSSDSLTGLERKRFDIQQWFAPSPPPSAPASFDIGARKARRGSSLASLDSMGQVESSVVAIRISAQPAAPPNEPRADRAFA